MCRLVQSTGDLEQQGMMTSLFVIAMGSNVPEQHLRAHPVSRLNPSSVLELLSYRQHQLHGLHEPNQGP